MTQLAEILISENLKTQKTVLDLGYCGLNGTENELYKPLKDATHLKTIIFSNNWREYSLQQQKWIDKFSNNEYDNLPNMLIQLPENLPTSLQKVILKGDIEFDRYDMQIIDYSFKIKDFSAFKAFKNLRFLDLSYGNIDDISFLEKLYKLECINLSHNPIKNIEVLKNIKNLRAIQIDIDNLVYPPIWFVKLNAQKGRVGDYTNIPQLPEVEKIWQLFSSDDEENINLAHQIAIGQGWTKEDFEMYKLLL